MILFVILHTKNHNSNIKNTTKTGSKQASQYCVGAVLYLYPNWVNFDPLIQFPFLTWYNVCPLTDSSPAVLPLYNRLNI